jgi:organic hydroperoxide reductase OsmC/OhrA
MTMDQLPHTYSASVSARPDDPVEITAQGLPVLQAAPPRQFGGPGDIWSPEDLLMASLSSCLVLSFRAIATLNKLDWATLDVTANGDLGKVDQVIKFTRVQVAVRLKVGADVDRKKAERLLQKAKASCFISNTLNCDTHLDCEIISD